MKKILYVSAVVAATFLSACGERVPKVDDPKNPVDLQGNPISHAQFLKDYCRDKVANKTCELVTEAAQVDSLNKGLPKEWR